MALNIDKYQSSGPLVGQNDSENNARLALLYEVGKKVGSIPRMAVLLQHVVQMTQRTLNARASSVLLYDDKDKKLVFDVAGGPAGKSLRQVKIGVDSGIAGWVVRNNKALIVNNVQSDQRFDKSVDVVTGFKTQSIMCVPLVVQRKVIGVIEVLNKLDGSDFTDRDVEAVVSVASTAAMSIENARLQQTIMEAYNSTMKALAAAIDAKDPYTRGHSERVLEYSVMAGIPLAFSGEEMDVLEHGAILHDIGKIAVGDQILNKPGSLTASEWEVIRQHPLAGANIVKDIPFLEKARELILHHHEWYNGKGYPGGLKGDDIPLGARLISVADTFDTMTTDRAYRPALSTEYALNELQKCAGAQFCPIAVEAFIDSYNSKANKGSNISVTDGLTDNIDNKADISKNGEGK
jgi:HD-GYP domain-containing protein (c-di-GMP phosphodiesterase class II)